MRWTRFYRAWKRHNLGIFSGIPEDKKSVVGIGIGLQILKLIVDKLVGMIWTEVISSKTGTAGRLL